MRTRFYTWLANLTTTHNKLLIAFCVFVTFVALFLSSKLQMKTQIADMMPQDIPQVKEYMKIIEDYSSASTVMITIESEMQDKEKMKACAENIASRLKNLEAIHPKEGQKLSLSQKIKIFQKKYPVDGVEYDSKPLVKRIDYKIDNNFIAEHGLIIQKTKDLKNTVEMFSSIALPDFIENINNNFEKEFVNDADNLATLDGEAQAVQGLESMRKFAKSITNYIDSPDSQNVVETISEFVTGPEYFFSSDNKMLLMMVQPTVSMNDFEKFMELGTHINDTLHAIQGEINDLKIGRSGMVILQIDETEALKKDFGLSSIVALLLILTLLIGSFKTWKNPLLSVLTLIIAIIWVSGALYIVLKYLDMMSASFGIVLIGLGIDFGIHFISGFKDGRESGLSIPDSINDMYNKVGTGVITGGVTTAAVFFMLTVTGMKSLSTMGIAVGTGIIVTLIAMMVLLPALIVMFTREIKQVKSSKNWLSENPLTDFLQFRFLESAGRGMSKMPIAVAFVIFSIITVYFSYNGSKTIKFEYDMMALEPIGLPSVITQDSILSKFEMAPDYALLSVKTEEECRKTIKKLKKMGNRTELIGRLDGITEFLPNKEVQNVNKTIISQFQNKIHSLEVPDTFTSDHQKKLVLELIRLHQNIVEIGELSISGSGEKNKIIKKCDAIVGKKDEDSEILKIAKTIKSLKNNIGIMSSYQRIMGQVLKEKLTTMSSTDIVTIDNLPEEIRKRYINPKTSEMLITIYPKDNIWNEKILTKFVEQTSKINEAITGTPAIMLLYIDLVKEKGGMAIMFGALAIIIILLIDFRSISMTLLAIIPLFVGTMWMTGLMALFSVKLNMVNFMALPLIIGIGIDDGVHILHRYKIEGKFSMPTVMHFTGRAILLTSLTTIIGFGSMAFASHRGIASMGLVLCFGVGSCFLSSAFLLPAIITVIEKTFKKNKMI